MATKISLHISKLKPLHISITKFAEIVKRDETLLPETVVILNSLKKARQNYVPLPISHDVIISPLYQVTLHKDTNPIAKIWTKFNWTDKNKQDYLDDSTKFVNDILKMYINDLGYEPIISEFNETEVKNIIDDLQKRSEKMLTKLKKLVRQ